MWSGEGYDGDGHGRGVCGYVTGVGLSSTVGLVRGHDDHTSCVTIVVTRPQSARCGTRLVWGCRRRQGTGQVWP